MRSVPTILMDLSLPVMSGWEAIRRLDRARNFLARIIALRRASAVVAHRSAKAEL
jgi:CheY-like chemotaxis protein